MKKFLDAQGLQRLWKQLSLKDYPNNEMLVTVINAIDEEKADKTALNDYLLIKDYVAGETGGGIVLDNYLTKNEAESMYAPKNILEIAYPVGSIYLSVNNTNPSSLFGFGTWEAIEDRFLLGASSTYVAGTTGGEATHTLTVDEIPSHNHTFLRSKFDNNEQNETGTTVFGINFKAASQITATTDAAGGSQAHNNMPPYLVVYMWKRVL